MARAETRTRGGGPGGRPPLEPADPLPGSKAVFQVLLLLALPIGLLFLAKILLRAFYPELGY